MPHLAAPGCILLHLVARRRIASFALSGLVCSFGVLCCCAGGAAVGCAASSRDRIVITEHVVICMAVPGDAPLHLTTPTHPMEQQETPFSCERSCDKILLGGCCWARSGSSVLVLALKEQVPATRTALCARALLSWEYACKRVPLYLMYLVHGGTSTTQASLPSQVPSGEAPLQSKSLPCTSAPRTVRLPAYVGRLYTVRHLTLCHAPY